MTLKILRYMFQAGDNRHHLEARFGHPFRTVQLEADYSKSDGSLQADLAFDWDKFNPQSV